LGRAVGMTAVLPPRSRLHAERSYGRCYVAAPPGPRRRRCWPGVAEGQVCVDRSSKKRRLEARRSSCTARDQQVAFPLSTWRINYPASSSAGLLLLLGSDMAERQLKRASVSTPQTTLVQPCALPAVVNTAAPAAVQTAVHRAPFRAHSTTQCPAPHAYSACYSASVDLRGSPATARLLLS
jgi:hypothetical protein